MARWLLPCGVRFDATRGSTRDDGSTEQKDQAARHAGDDQWLSDARSRDHLQDSRAAERTAGAVEPRTRCSVTGLPRCFGPHDRSDTDARAAVPSQDTSGGQFADKGHDDAAASQGETGEQHVKSETGTSSGVKYQIVDISDAR